MRIADIEAELPNGFHDAKLIAFRRNLINETAKFEIEVLMGLPEDEPEDRERVRIASLNFKGTKVVVIEAPRAESSFQSPGPASIVVTENEPGALSGELLGGSNKLRTYTIFVRDWLSNIQIAASDVEFAWGGGSL